jgi:hypothetical protein
MNESEKENLRLLSIFHYVLGGLTALFACFPFIHLAVGIFFVCASGRPGAGGDVPPAFIGWIFIAVASVIILMGWAMAGCMIAAGRLLAQRRHHLFCLVVACVECVFVPLGTVLGVFSIIVLTKESTKALFPPPAARV